MDHVRKTIFEAYGIRTYGIQNLSGGWMNEKILIESENNMRYIFKIYSSKKIEKMSKGEFGVDYLDNQSTCNLWIENYMHTKSLNCPKIIPSSNGRLMIVYGENRATLMSYINGQNVPRNAISDIQLYNLGHECGYMHLLFENVDREIYNGRYLKLPTIEELGETYKKSIKLIMEIVHYI